MHRDVLVAKFEARARGIANLTVVRDAQQASLDKLVSQIGEHEIAMAECDGSSAGKQRWLKWAEIRLGAMNDQRKYYERELDATNASIVRLRTEANGFQRELDAIDIAQQREIKHTIATTIAAADGRKRAEQPDKKKDKKAKAQQQGHKKGKGHKKAA